jgi:hypothetical protein
MEDIRCICDGVPGGFRSSPSWLDTAECHSELHRRVELLEDMLVLLVLNLSFLRISAKLRGTLASFESGILISPSSASPVSCVS